MRLLINAASTFKGGSVQVAYSFIHECKKYGENHYIVVLSESISQIINPNEFPDNFTFYDLKYRPATRVFKWQKTDEDLNRIAAIENPDVVFTTSGPSYWSPNVPHLCGFNLGHYIYDDSPYFRLISIYQRIKWGFKGLVIKYFYKRDVDQIVCQTEDVAIRASNWLGIKKVHVVSNTCGDAYLNPITVPNKLKKRDEKEFRVFTLSSYYRHKNLEIINDIVPFLLKKGIEDVKFVLTLPPEDLEHHFTQEAKEYIINVGGVPIDEGYSIYKECDIMFLPTLMECFSASYPEAMITKTPILTTNLSFARGICEDAALYYTATSAEAAIEKILALKKDENLRTELIKKGEKRWGYFLTPSQRAEKYLSICESLIPGNE